MQSLRVDVTDIAYCRKSRAVCRDKSDKVRPIEFIFWRHWCLPLVLFGTYAGCSIRSGHEIGTWANTVSVKIAPVYVPFEDRPDFTGHSFIIFIASPSVYRTTTMSPGLISFSRRTRSSTASSIESPCGPLSTTWRVP